jgi:hypothetical protein
VAVVGFEAAEDAGAANEDVYNGDYVAELGFESGVEVGAALDGGEAVGVCGFGENADVAAVFELDAWIRSVHMIIQNQRCEMY